MSDAPTVEPSPDTAERPENILDGVAAEAWQAYNAMETTKRRHIELLETLDLKRVNYGLEPTAAEATLLAGLLADHDAQVRRFADASSTLKADDANAHQQLFAYVARVTGLATGNTADGAAPRTH